MTVLLTQGKVFNVQGSGLFFSSLFLPLNAESTFDRDELSLPTKEEKIRSLYEESEQVTLQGYKKHYIKGLTFNPCSEILPKCLLTFICNRLA
jgi:hypothetical protein